MRDISGPLLRNPPSTKGEGFLEFILSEFDKNDPNYTQKVNQRVKEAAHDTVTLPVECMPP